MNYNEFASLPISSKVVLCHIYASKRLAVFEVFSGSVYRRQVSHFVSSVDEDGTSLTQASNTSLSAGQFYYDIQGGYLYVRMSDDSNPKTKNVVVDYKFFFSSIPIALPHDLGSGDEVYYEGRLKKNSPTNKELDDEQIGIVLETATNVSIENTDGYFDQLYDTLIFENKRIVLWSWSELILLSKKQVLFDGFIQHKKFGNTVSFSCKDSIYSLRKNIDAENFSENDGNIPERYLNKPKRRLFGRFKQLQCTPVDAVLDGFQLTGTVSSITLTRNLSGVGTNFLDEVSPDDEIIFFDEYDTKIFTVESITSDTLLTLSSEPETAVSGSVLCKPARPWRKKNRNWHIAGHKLRAPSTTITDSRAPNRFVVSDVSDFEAGDLIEVNGEEAFILRISQNLIVLSANLQAGKPDNGWSVTKNPLTKAYAKGSEIFINRDWTVNNGANNAILQLDELTEFNIAREITTTYTLNFTNGTRQMTRTGYDLTQVLQSRDWIRIDNVSYPTWYEVLSVVYDPDTDTSTITTRTNYIGPTGASTARIKNVDLIDDDSVICVDCIGQERNGAWIKTASDAVKDIIENDLGLSNIDTDSFIESDFDAPFVLSYAIPEEIGGNKTKIRDVISNINKSVFGSLTINNNFQFKYQVLTPEKPTDLELIKDDDIIGVSSINSKNEIVRKVSSSYSFFADKFTGDKSFELYEFENDFVDKLVGVQSELEIDTYLFYLDDAKTIAQRYALYNSLSQSTLTIRGKLNLALKSLNDKIYIQLDRLYKRFGSVSNRKIGIINKVSNDGRNVELKVNDLGNTFNRVGNIADDSSNDFTSADDDEKIKNGYIVDDDILTPDTSDDSSIYSNLIG